MSLLAHRCRLSATSPLRAVAALPLLRAAAAPRLWLSSVGEAAALSSPPEHLDERERHVWEKLARELEPTRLEVSTVWCGCGMVLVLMVLLVLVIEKVRWAPPQFSFPPHLHAQLSLSAG